MGRLIQTLRKKLALIGMLAVLAWMGFVLVLPTWPIQRRLQAILSDRIGQPVVISAVKVGWLGSVTLLDLGVGPADSQWLRVHRIMLPLDFGRILQGQIWPERCQVEGLQATVQRADDGTWRIGPWDTRSAPAEREEEPADNAVLSLARSAASRLEIEVSGGTLLVADEPSRTRIEVDHLVGEANWEPGRLEIERLTGNLAGGQVELAARLNREPGTPWTEIEGNLAAREVKVDDNMGVLSYLVPMVANEWGGLAGLLDATLDFEARADRPADLWKRLTGTARLDLREVRLEGTPLIEEAAQLLGAQNRVHLGRASGSFLIRDERVGTRDLVVQLGQTPVQLSGWTDFEGRVSFVVHCDRLTSQVASLAEQLPPEVRRLAQDLNLPSELDRLAEVQLRGTRGNLKLEARGIRRTASSGGAGSPVSVPVDLGRMDKAIQSLKNRARTPVRR